MSQSLFPDDIVYISEADFTEGPHTPGQPRQTAYETDGLWVGVTRVTARDVPSQWHHHADHDSIMYMIAGQIRVDWGEEGEKSFVIGPGEIALFRRGVIHRAQIIDAEEDVRFMVVRTGSGETVMNVDGPGPNVIVC